MFITDPSFYEERTECVYVEVTGHHSSEVSGT